MKYKECQFFSSFLDQKFNALKSIKEMVNAYAICEG